MKTKKYLKLSLITLVSSQLIGCTLAGDIAQTVFNSIKKEKVENTSSEDKPVNKSDSPSDSSSNSTNTKPPITQAPDLDIDIEEKEPVSSTQKNTPTKEPEKSTLNNNSSFLSNMENEVIEQLNFARSEPARYAQEVLIPMRKFYKNGFIEYPGEIRIITNEGISALEEAIEFMKDASPVGPLSPSRGMSLAAKDHVKDQSSTGETGHDGSDGSDPFSRMERYGQFQKTAGENIDYGNNVAERVVTSLIIDDGVSSRGHRTNIMKPAFKVVGVASGTHPQFRHMFVQTFAGGFVEK